MEKETKPEYLKKLSEKGWSDARAGNLSFHGRTEGFSPKYKTEIPFETAKYPALIDQQLMISRKGADLNQYTEFIKNDLLSVRFTNDYMIIEGISEEHELSSEYLSHFLLHQYLIQNHSGKKCILHVHPDEFIAISHSSKIKTGEQLTSLIYSYLPETQIHIRNGISFVAYQPAGSRELAEATLSAYQGEDLIVWEKHGVLSLASDWQQAIEIIEAGVKALRIYFLTKSLYLPD